MRAEHLEAAVPVGADPKRHARVLATIHDATLAGTSPPARPRPVIEASWRRMRGLDLDPDRGGDPAPLSRDQLEDRRRASGLSAALPTLREGLVSVADEAAHVMVVVDAEGHVLWREGSPSVSLRADLIGLCEGASWTECSAGTNAIGTALVARRPLQVYAAEHYVRRHHPWTCSAAPVHDPRDGSLLGIVDLSGPATSVHATTLALVDTAARLAEFNLRMIHRTELDRLRAAAVPLLSRLRHRAVVVDEHGWVAATTGMAPLDRILLPRRTSAGEAWLPSFGHCRLEPVPGGWLVRVLDDHDEAVPTRVVLDVRAPRDATVTVIGDAGSWAHSLSPRHAELLYLLARHPDGQSAAELARGLFGDADRAVTVRAEMARLRRHVGGVLAHRPYRFADGVDVVVREPTDPAALLPYSTAPALRGV